MAWGFSRHSAPGTATRRCSSGTSSGLRRSARELDLPFDADAFPDVRAVADLIEANRDTLAPGQDVRLRLTLSGGLATTPPIVIGPLDDRDAAATSDPNCSAGGHHPVDASGHGRPAGAAQDTQLLAQADRCGPGEQQAGSDDVLCVTADGLICETCRANMFLVEGRRLITPGLDGPLLPGVMRHSSWNEPGDWASKSRKGRYRSNGSSTADEAFLTNSLRGMLPWPGCSIASCRPRDR